ncbi:MAG: type II secretion system protein [Desulfurivibrio sp.]|nr:type II secretion system protein [Desulfurivibrio sp.]
MSNDSQQGFTLIEVIASMVLLGIMLAIAGMGIVSGVRGYLLAQENAVITQKAQLALGRLSRELRECFDCVNSDEVAGAITSPYTYAIPDHENQQLAWGGGDTITLNGDPLVDQVAAFELRFADDAATSRLKLELTMKYKITGDTVKFTTTVLPRNLYTN